MKKSKNKKLLMIGILSVLFISFLFFFRSQVKVVKEREAELTHNTKKDEDYNNYDLDDDHLEISHVDKEEEEEEEGFFLNDDDDDDYLSEDEDDYDDYEANFLEDDEEDSIIDSTEVTVEEENNVDDDPFKDEDEDEISDEDEDEDDTHEENQFFTEEGGEDFSQADGDKEKDDDDDGNVEVNVDDSFNDGDKEKQEDDDGKDDDKNENEVKIFYHEEKYENETFLSDGNVSVFLYLHGKKNYTVFTNNDGFINNQLLRYRKNSWEKNENLTILDQGFNAPMMGQRTQDIFIRYSKEAKNIFEYGGGGTTHSLAQLENVEHIWTTDPAEGWLVELMNTHVIRHALKTGKIDVVKVYYGPLKTFSWPKNNIPEMWTNWAYSIDLLDKNSRDKIDLVFVDGRFRISCILYSMLRTKKDCKYMIHDAERFYREILEFAELIEYGGDGDKIAVFKKRNDISMKYLEKLFEQYKYVKA